MDKMLLAQQWNRAMQILAQNTDISDEEKLEIACVYPKWTVAHNYKTGDVIKYITEEDKEPTLYEVIQDHTSQADWLPTQAASLYKVICADDTQGTLENPITAVSNMEYFSGKYYIEDGALYLCTRDSGVPLQHLPSQLVGNYFIAV